MYLDQLHQTVIILQEMNHSILNGLADNTICDREAAEEVLEENVKAINRLNEEIDEYFS